MLSMCIAVHGGLLEFFVRLFVSLVKSACDVSWCERSSAFLSPTLQKEKALVFNTRQVTSVLQTDLFFVGIRVGKYS